MKITVASWFDREALLAAGRIVRISNSKPRQAKCHAAIHQFIPAWEIVRDLKAGLIDEIEYTNRYVNKVRPVMSQAIRQLRDGDVLCCWCQKGKFCHRLLVADMLMDHNVDVQIR